MNNNRHQALAAAAKLAACCSIMWTLGTFGIILQPLGMTLCPSTQRSLHHRWKPLLFTKFEQLIQRMQRHTNWQHSGFLKLRLSLHYRRKFVSKVLYFKARNWYPKQNTHVRCSNETNRCTYMYKSIWHYRHSICYYTQPTKADMWHHYKIPIFSFSNNVIQLSMNNCRRILTHSSTSFTIYNSITHVHDSHLPLSHLLFDFSIEWFTKPVTPALLCLVHIYVFHKQLFNLHIIIHSLIYQCTTIT